MNETIKLDDASIDVINPFAETAYFDSINIGDIVLKNNVSLKYFILKINDLLVFETNEQDCQKYLKNESTYNSK